MTPDRRRLIALALLGAIVLGAAAVWVVGVTAAPSPSQRAGEIARSYATRTTIWNRGPTVRKVIITGVRDLPAALRRTVSSRVADDVDVPDLERRVGAHRQVALVVLHGIFNTLPPDEGIVVNSDMVAVVDMSTKRVLLLTD